MKFPLFNKEKEVLHKKDDGTNLKGMEIKLWDHYKIFHKYKDELNKTNYK